MEIHQFIPTLAAGDAIGSHTLGVQEALRSAGHRSDLYADDVHPEMRGRALPYGDYLRRRGDGPRWILFQMSTGSPITDFVLGAGDPVMIDYHNITPDRFFERWEPRAAANMRAARDDLRRLRPVTRFALADSSYNEADLHAEGFTATAVAPILLDFAAHAGPHDERLLSRLRHQAGGGTRWLFVGRVAPNKCQHDIVAAFAAYRRLHDPAARLTLVGGGTAPLYWGALERQIHDLGVGGAVELTDAVSDAALRSHYRAADVFVCLSEHEGFNVPVLEAMHAGVPVVALAATAIPETVGDGGLLLTHKRPLVVAAAVHRVVTDPGLRGRLVEAGHRRVEHFSLENTRKQLLDGIEQALSHAPAGAAVHG